MFDALAVGLWVLPVSALRLCIMRLTIVIHELNISWCPIHHYSFKVHDA
jgi:hypothetical protein